MLTLLAASAVWISISKVCDLRHGREMTKRRSNESICDFAKSFPRRTTDTLVLRAVYESLQDFVASPSVPIRSLDRLVEDLRLGVEDLDDLVDEVSELAGRSTDDWEKNPYFGKVETVGDLVRFTMVQPSSNKSVRMPLAEAGIA